MFLSVWSDPPLGRHVGTEPSVSERLEREQVGRIVAHRTGLLIRIDLLGRVLRCHDDGRGHKVCMSGREDY